MAARKRNLGSAVVSVVVVTSVRGDWLGLFISAGAIGKCDRRVTETCMCEEFLDVPLLRVVSL